VKLNDAVWGALLLLLATAVLVHVQSFGTIPGQKYGPAIFPGLVACGIAICAVLLIFNGLTARTEDGRRVGPMTLAPWTRSRRHVFAFALTIGINVFYISSSTNSDSFRRASSTSPRCSPCSALAGNGICRSRSC
jgi:putative tricarboxylic transport membrane protein